MTQLIRRTPEEMEIYFLSHISELKYEAKAFEEKAVEVLADKLHQIGTTNAYLAGTRYMEHDLWEMATEETKDRYRAEAKQLLGVNNNDKEK